jgi:hypothetical protein
MAEKYVKYVFREPLTIKNASKTDAQTVGEALDKIKVEKGGELSVGDVWRKVEKSPRHPLFKHYEWDQRLAAEAHWDDTDRRLIRCVRVVTSEDGEETAPAYYSISVNGEKRTYRHHDDVMRSAELQMAVLLAAEKDLKDFESRYRALSDVCDMVRDVREKVSKKRRDLDDRQTAS